eukprot:COSAG02_NODE_2340_length_9105_cov_47.424051_5_plen_1377_part_01
MPRAGSVEVVVRCASDPVPPMLFFEVEPVSCDVTSTPNEDGNACECVEGLARLPNGECGRCLPSTQPKVDREAGCESCSLYVGTVSVSGLSCERCGPGLRPASTLDMCVPCPEGLYFDQINQLCSRCPDGSELDPNEEATEPCRPCDAVSAGLSGFCSQCISGKQPNNDRTECVTCPAGYAGIGGVCEICPAGTQPYAEQQQCLNCLPGKYRNDEQTNECLECATTMTSPTASVTSGACYCPEGTYDIQDNRNNLSPIWCFLDGLQSAPHTLDDNLPSVPDIALGRRCVRCPDCLNCIFDGYVGNPMVQDGWTVINDKLPRLMAPGTPKLSAFEFVGRPRYVYGCPFGEVNEDDSWRGGSCLSELEYSNQTTANGTQTCTEGYHGDVCGECDPGHTAVDSGCTKCEGAMESLMIVIGVACFLFGVLFIAVPILRRNQQRREMVDAFQRVTDSVGKDLQVFIGVYQIFSSMGKTLGIKFPPHVEYFISLMRGLVDLDVFSLPGLACLSPGDYYDKLTASVMLPTCLVGLIGLGYLVSFWRMHLGHIPNPELDELAQDQLKGFHHKSRKAKHAENDDWEHSGIFRSHKQGGDDHAKKKQEAESHHSDFSHHGDLEEEMQKRYALLHQKADLQQSTVSQIFWVIFLCYPSVTNKVFGFFVCYQVSDESIAEAGLRYGKSWENQEIGYLVSDFSVSCHDDQYELWYKICVVLVIAIPVGIPVYLGGLLASHKEAIAEHHGPHYLEPLYEDYKPECCMWETYQMMQKVTLVGLLTFIDRGSVLQCLAGLFVANVVLMAMLKDRPYIEVKTNVLAIFGQQILVVAFLSSLLLRVDLTGEAFTANTIGNVLLASNVPMIVYLIYDCTVSMKYEIHAAKIDLLRASLGDIGAHYRCIVDEGVEINPNMRDFLGSGISVKGIKAKAPNVIGRVDKDEVVVANGQAIDFHPQGGSVARLHIKSKGVRGWCSFNHPGAFGKRNFVLVSTQNVKGEASAIIHCKAKRKGNVVSVTIMECGDILNDLEDGERKAIFVLVRVNGVSQRTAYSWVVDPKTEEVIDQPSWNQGTGQTLSFPLADEEVDEQPDDLESVIIKLYGSKEGESTEKAAIRKELAELDIGTLRKRAEKDGVSKFRIDKARDGHQPKFDLIELIFAKEAEKVQDEKETDDLIGVLPLPIDNELNDEEWERDFSGIEALTVHKELQEEDLYANGHEDVDAANSVNSKPNVFKELSRDKKAKRKWGRSVSGLLLSTGDVNDEEPDPSQHLDMVIEGLEASSDDSDDEAGVEPRGRQQFDNPVFAAGGGIAGGTGRRKSKKKAKIGRNKKNSKAGGSTQNPLFADANSRNSLTGPASLSQNPMYSLGDATSSSDEEDEMPSEEELDVEAMD